MTFLTPTGLSCPIPEGALCEIHWADGAIFIGQFRAGIMTGTTGFIPGDTGYMGDKFASSWVWAEIGDCIPVRRYRVTGEEAFRHVERIAAAPGPLVDEQDPVALG